MNEYFEQAIDQRSQIGVCHGYSHFVKTSDCDDHSGLHVREEAQDDRAQLREGNWIGYHASDSDLDSYHKTVNQSLRTSATIRTYCF